MIQAILFGLLHLTMLFLMLQMRGRFEKARSVRNIMRYIEKADIKCGTDKDNCAPMDESTRMNLMVLVYQAYRNTSMDKVDHWFVQVAENIAQFKLKRAVKLAQKDQKKAAKRNA